MTSLFSRPARFCALLLFLLLLPVVTANVNITISENGKIISFYDQYYIYQVNGTISITNPTNFTLYNIEIPIYLSSLDIRTNYSSEDNYMIPDEIFLFALGPEESYSFAYKIVGITTEDLSTNGKSVLSNGINMFQPKIYSNLFGTLKKAPMEDPAFTGRDARLISVELRNPTSFEYVIDLVKVIKTPAMDPNAQINVWDFTNDKSGLGGGEGWDFDFIDDNATEGEVYWLTTDIYIDNIEVYSLANISRYDQDDLFEVISNVTINDTVNDSLDLLANRIYLRKLVSKTLVTPGDVVNVTLIVNNFEPHDVFFSIVDIVPEGFEIIEIKDGVLVGKNVTWNVTLSTGAGRRLRYSIRYTNPDLLGIDYFKPAELTYDEKTYYSQSIPFVRNYIPEKRVFVQKNVKFLSGDEVQVTLSVQNLGETPLQNVMLKEHLLSTAEFREISIAPMQRGLWKIEYLRQSEKWTTTYITDKMSVSNSMPDVYGVPQGSVLQTIILSNLINSKYSVLQTNVVEIVGIIALAIILLLYLTPTSFFSRTQQSQNRDLRTMSRELFTLKQKTDKHNQTMAREQQKGAESVQAPSPAGTPYQSKLHAPERLARHEAVSETAEEIEAVKKTLSGDEEAPVAPEKPKE